MPKESPPDTRPLVERMDTPEKWRAYNAKQKREWRARKKAERLAAEELDNPTIEMSW